MTSLVGAHGGQLLAAPPTLVVFVHAKLRGQVYSFVAQSCCFLLWFLSLAVPLFGFGFLPILAPWLAWPSWLPSPLVGALVASCLQLFVPPNLLSYKIKPNNTGMCSVDTSCSRSLRGGSFTPLVSRAQVPPHRPQHWVSSLAWPGWLPAVVSPW